MKNKNFLIEMMRFIMASYIMLFHIRDISPIGEWFVHGNAAVSFFFILSGFLMAKKTNTIMADSVKADVVEESYKYIIKRLKSLYSSYFIIFMISLLYMIIRHRIQIDIGSWIKELLLLQTIDVNSSSLVPQSWYLSALLILSFVIYPIILFTGEYYIKILAPIISLFTFGYLSNKYGYLGGVLTIDFCMTKGILWGISGLNFGIFLFGVRDILKNKKILCIFSNIVSIVMSLLYLSFPDFCLDDFSVSFFMGVIVLSSFNLDFKRVKIDKLVHYLGELSMYLFLVHMFIRKSIISEMSGKGITNQIIVYLIYIISTVLISIILMNAMKIINSKYAC